MSNIQQLKYLLTVFKKLRSETTKVQSKVEEWFSRTEGDIGNIDRERVQYFESLEQICDAQSSVIEKIQEAIVQQGGEVPEDPFSDFSVE